VRVGELTRREGAQLLNAKTGMPATSAGIVIAVYLNMSMGQVFKRTLSASDMEFVIGCIADDEGPTQLKKALTALRLHIEYRESDGVNPLKNKTILEKYENCLKNLATVSKSSDLLR
jgi:5-methylcytosine-specific restriction protein A